MQAGASNTLNMKWVKAYIRLLRWYRLKNNRLTRPIITENDDDNDEITEFDLQPYLGWMEEEFKNKQRVAMP